MNNQSNIQFQVFFTIEECYRYLSNELVGYFQANPSLAFSFDDYNFEDDLTQNLVKAYEDGKIDFSQARYFLCLDYAGTKKDIKKYFDNSLLNVAWTNFLSKTNFDQNNLLPFLNKKGKIFAKATLENYEQSLDANEGIDILVIKLRGNDQLIFNYDYADESWITRQLALDDVEVENIFNEALYINNYQENSWLTIGLNEINRAKKIYVLAFGEYNIDNIKKLFFKRLYDQNSVVCMLKNHPDVTVLIDKECSFGLFNRPLEEVYELSKPNGL